MEVSLRYMKRDHSVNWLSSEALTLLHNLPRRVTSSAVVTLGRGSQTPRDAKSAPGSPCMWTRATPPYAHAKLTQEIVSSLVLL